MKSALLIIAACIIILLLPATLTAINDFRMVNYTEPHIITTTSPDTTAPVTLTQALYDSSAANAAVSSNNTNDAPLSLSYVSATKVLTVDGLELNKTRTLTVTYKIDALAAYTGAGIAVKVWPIFLILGVIGLIVGGVYNATKHGE